MPSALPVLCHRMSEPIPNTIASATGLVVRFGNAGNASRELPPRCGLVRLSQ
jgi:hypothetical protein